MTLDGLRQLLCRVEHRLLEPNDWGLVGALVSKQIARAEAQQDRLIAKLEATAAAEAEAGPVIDAEFSVPEAPDGGQACTTQPPKADDAASDGGSMSAADNDPVKDEGDSDKPKGSKAVKGHGRNGATAYRKAKDIIHVLVGVIGAICAACGRGRMTRARTKIVIRIVGQPLFGAERHHFEQARCRLCYHTIRAEGIAEVLQGIGTDYITYDWSACAMLMVMHYSGGLPFKRIDSLHEGWGVPMPDANQWELASTGHDLSLPLFKALERHAIQTATNFRIDDTGSMVIGLQKQINAELAALQGLGESTKDVRTGINATGSYWETPDGPVILFYTGRHHAGEIIDQTLKHRSAASPKLVKCTDAASKNFDHAQGDKVIDATCNAHAFLKFRDIRDKYPADYAEAGRVYKQVFDNDDKAAALGLSPIDRMLYHRQHSKPLLEELKKYCAERIKSRLVEPNSPPWEPLSFIINQWDRLVRFCDVPNVPLDTNLVEQALIMPVRYLAGSFNYQTVDGALVGDRVMSLIATACKNDVEPVAYLTECLRCHEDLAKRPEYYLPWKYRERLKAGGSPPAPAREQPPEASAGGAAADAADPPQHLTDRGLRDFAPELRERTTRRVAAPDQDLQLAGKEG